MLVSVSSFFHVIVLLTADENYEAYSDHFFNLTSDGSIICIENEDSVWPTEILATKQKKVLE